MTLEQMENYLWVETFHVIQIIKRCYGAEML